jgi:ribosomal protein L24E
MSEVKKCPYCGGEMQNGYVISDGQIICWSEKKSSIFLVKGELLKRSIWTPINLKAHRCTHCELVLFYYPQ